MPHYGIFGQTGSGKTRLAMLLAGRYRVARRPVFVLDPMWDDRWPADYKTPYAAEFFRFVWRYKGCMVFIDECGGFGKFNADVAKLLTKGRHLGHSVHIISQRPQQIDPLIRAQLIRGYLFNLDVAGMQCVAESFGKKELFSLPIPGVRVNKNSDFYILERYGPISRFVLEFKSGRILKSAG